MALLGYSGFVEHPQYPTWTGRSDVTSIWCLRATKLLRRLNCVTVVSFDQCTCGALGRKPTTLLLVRMSQVRRRLLALGRGGRCNHHKGAHQALIGKQEDGTFQTAKAKIYPYKLNLILGQAMHTFAADHLTAEVAKVLPDEFAPYTEETVFHGSHRNPKGLSWLIRCWCTPSMRHRVLIRHSRGIGKWGSNHQPVKT